MTRGLGVIAWVATLLLVGCGRIAFDQDIGLGSDSTNDDTNNGTGCAGGAPRCGDGSCARLAWRFDDGSLGGIRVRAPDDQVLAVRSHDSNPALAADVVELSEVSFYVPVCQSSSLPLQTRELTATVYYQDSLPPSGLQYYMQTAMPEPMANAYLTTIDLSSAEYTYYSAPINLSQFAAAGTTIVFQLGTLGMHFTGTIWVDDIEIH